MIHSTNRFLYLVFSLGLALALLGMLGIGLDKARAAVNSPVTTFVVTNTDDSGSGSLREAIVNANASPGADLISITVSGTVLLNSPLPVITDPLTIQGPGISQFAIDGSGSFRVLDIAMVDVTLSDLTVRGGYVSGASAYGAGIRTTGDLTLLRVGVVDNIAQSQGGGLYTTGILTITDSLFQNNRSLNSLGGGIRSGNTTINGAQFIGNTSRGDGGGLFTLGLLVVNEGIFLDNKCLAFSCDGGGLFSFSNTSIQNTQFISNTAQDQGGGMSGPGSLVISGGLFQNNRAVFGTGGGLLAQNLVTIQDTQFISNTARGSGGGIYALAAADLTDTVFRNNSSTNGTGGGLHASGSLTMDRTQFLQNTAREGGGLAHSLNDGYLVNTLFAENIAMDTTGMALYLASTGTVELLHLTVVGPAAADGTAIEVVEGNVEIVNTIIANHAIGINNAGANVLQDFNLFFGNGADTQGNITGGSGSLKGNPFFSNTTADDYHLGVGSAALDAGTNAGVVMDFDGDSRPQNAGFDIGFDERIELDGTPTPTLDPDLTPEPTPTPTPPPSSTPTVEPGNYLISLPLIQK